MSHPSLKYGLVVSDLHLFARRSEGARLFSELESRTEETDGLVLNGDTFDFRWSRLPSESASIDAAMEWIERLLARQPDRDIHFVLGNHDCLADFRSELEALAAGHSRLHVHEQRLRLGDCLFLHGDCANRRMNEAALGRFRDQWSRDRQRGPAAAAAYGAVDALGLSRRFHHWYFPAPRTVRRVAHHLDQVMPDWTRQVAHCYFGHTHRPFRDFSWRGVRFSNTGSGIRGMGFQPLEFSWNPPSSLA